METIRRKQIYPRTNQIRKAKKQTPFTKANLLQTNKAIQPTRLLVRWETKLSNLPRPKQTTKTRRTIRTKNRRRRATRRNSLRENTRGAKLHPRKEKATDSRLGHLQILQANPGEKNIGTRSKFEEDRGIQNSEREMVWDSEGQGGKGLFVL